MWANILITLSAAVAILALLDIFLSNDQKGKLSNAAVAMWNILDDAKKWSVADWLKNPRATLWLAITLCLMVTTHQSAYLMHLSAMHPGKPASPAVFLVPLTAAPLFFITPPIFARILRVGRNLFYNIAIILICISPIYISLLFFGLTVISRLDRNNDYVVIIIVGWALSILPVSLILLCALIIISAILLAYAVTPILPIGEFAVRRIAEYPKGQILGLSTVFGCVVAIIKAFS